MANFLSQVKSLTGLDIDGSSNPSQTELSQWLTDGAVDVINKVTKLRPDELHKFTTTISDNNNAGVDVSGKVLSVLRGTYFATPMDSSLRTQALDPDSLYYRSAYNPGWYSLNGRIYTIPASDATATEVTQVGYPTVAYGDENIAFTYLKKGIQTVTAGTETFNSTANTLSNGELVRINGLTGANAVLNGTVGIVTNAAADSFKLQNITIDVQASIGTDAYFERAGQGFADEYEYLVVMYAAIKALNKKLATKNDELPSDLSDLVLEEGTLPILGTLPVFNSPVTPSSVDIDYSGVPSITSFSSPLFTAPVLEEMEPMIMPVAPIAPEISSANSVSITGTAPIFTAPVVSIPDVPTIAALSISHRPPLASANVQGSMTITGSAPVYVPPIYVPDALTNDAYNAWAISDDADNGIQVGDLPAMPDPPTFIAEKLDGLPLAPTYAKPSMTMPNKPATSVYTIPDLVLENVVPTKITSAYNSMTEDRTLPTLPAPPEYDPPVMATPDWADANFWLSDEEDSEIVASRMQIISGQIQEFQVRAQAAQSEFNEKVTAYQANVQNIMADFQAENQIHIENKKMYTQGVDVKAKNNLALMAGEVQKYQTEVNLELARWQYDCEKDIKKWQSDCDNILKQYNADIQNELNEFNKENTIFQTQVQRQLAELQTKGAKQQLELTNYQAAISRYNADVNAHIQVNQVRASKKTQGMQIRMQESLNKHEQAVKNAVNSYNAEVKEYDASLQKDITNAQLTDSKRQRDLQYYQAELQEYQTKVQSDLQEYQQNLAREIQLYQSEAQTQLQKLGADTQNAVNAFNKENVEYQALLQKDIQNAQLSEAKDRRILEKYGAELSEYQANVNKEIQRWTSEEYNIKFNKWLSTYQNSLAEYNSNIQKEGSRVGSEISHYQAEVSKRLQTYQSETGLDVTLHQNQLQAAIQKFQGDMAEKTTAFDRDLAKYQAIVGSNNVKLQKFGVDIQNYAAKINKARVDYEWMTSIMMKLQTDYDTAFAIMQPQQRQEA